METTLAFAPEVAAFGKPHEASEKNDPVRQKHFFVPFLLKDGQNAARNVRSTILVLHKLLSNDEWLLIGSFGNQMEKPLPLFSNSLCML